MNVIESNAKMINWTTWRRNNTVDEGARMINDSLKISTIMTILYLFNDEIIVNESNGTNWEYSYKIKE